MMQSERERESWAVADELNKVDGISVDSVYDLVNTRARYPQAIPVLVRLLNDKVRDPAVLEGIVRALSVREARGVANEALFNLFFSLPPSPSALKWAIGNALKVIAQPRDFEFIERAVTDRSHGTSRQELVASLGKIKSSRSEELLLGLLDDDQVAAHALEALSKLRCSGAVTKAKQLLGSPKEVVRKEAKAYLRKWNSGNQ